MFFWAFLFDETHLHKLQPGTLCHWDALEHFKKSIILKTWIWHFLKSTFETNILWTLMKNLNFDEKLELWWKTWTLMKNLNFDEKLELWWKLNIEIWIMDFLKCSLGHSSLARPSCTRCSPGRNAIEMLLNI